MKKLSVIFVLLFSIFFFNLPHSEAASSQLLIINKQSNTLAFYDSGKLVKTFKVATGRSRDLTPEGKFRVVTKIKNRPYYKGGIPGGDPRNPLGDRWMGLEARGTYGTTYGIHGNNNESSIGKYVSSGCVRMHNEEVRWLYDQVQLYTTVIITYSSSSFDAIAKANGYSATTSGWVLNGGKWYYYMNGTAKTGWLSQGSTWYYFDGSGVMKTGWVLTNGKWYYLDKSGAMKTGWVYTGGKWYYLDSSGAMKTGWLEINGSKYFLNSDGAMGIGWKEIEGKWYFFNASGSMAANTVINGYKLGADGSWIQVEYVALGDSLAAGMTPLGEDKKPVNGVDPNWGYPNYIAEKFAKSYQLIDFVNYGVSGYKTDDVIADLGKAEVQKEIKEATHVTIDIGANDLLPVIQTNPADAPATIATIAAKLNGILSTIDALNPKVKVYVMGYYNPFPYVTDVQQKAQFEQLLTAMNGQIQAQAVKNGDTFVPTAQVINTANFAEYLPNPQNIHLSVTGYQVVAGEFWKVMQ